MSTPDKIYEVVDSTDEAEYYALGLFFSRDEALSVLDSEEPPQIEAYDPDSVTVAIRERPIGWAPYAFNVIARKTWVRDYESEPVGWKVIPTILPKSP